MQNQEYVPWKRYTLAVTETIFTFTVATFLLGLYIMHYRNSSIFLTVLVALLYLAAVITSVTRMVRKFSLAANMLMIPIAPLLILVIVVSLVHLLEWFK